MEVPHFLYPHKYMRSFLELGVRVDGRVLDAPRPVSINVGSISSADGSALVRYGDTLIVCGVKMELVSSQGSNEGFLVCNVDCGSGSLPEYTSGPPGNEVQVLTEQLQQTLEHCVDLSQLSAGELVWVVHVDVVCLSHHGNLLDACSLAGVAALQNTKMSSLCMDSNPPVIDTVADKVGLPLISPVLTVSFALINEWSVLDPVLEEEKAAQGHLSVYLHLDGTITGLEHTGHKVSEQQILKLSKQAVKRIVPLYELLETSQHKNT